MKLYDIHFLSKFNLDNIKNNVWFSWHYMWSIIKRTFRQNQNLINFVKSWNLFACLVFQAKSKVWWTLCNPQILFKNKCPHRHEFTDSNSFNPKHGGYIKIFLFLLLSRNSNGLFAPKLQPHSTTVSFSCHWFCFLSLVVFFESYLFVIASAFISNISQSVVPLIHRINDKYII